jgi:hypothetical protein
MAMAPSTAYSHERPQKAAPSRQVVSARAADLRGLGGFGTAGALGLGLGSVVAFGRRRKDDAKSSRD